MPPQVPTAQTASLLACKAPAQAQGKPTAGVLARFNERGGSGQARALCKQEELGHTWTSSTRMGGGGPPSVRASRAASLRLQPDATHVRTGSASSPYSGSVRTRGHVGTRAHGWTRGLDTAGKASRGGHHRDSTTRRLLFAHRHPVPHGTPGCFCHRHQHACRPPATQPPPLNPTPTLTHPAPRRPCIQGAAAAPAWARQAAAATASH